MTKYYFGNLVCTLEDNDGVHITSNRFFFDKKEQLMNEIVKEHLVRFLEDLFFDCPNDNICKMYCKAYKENKLPYDEDTEFCWKTFFELNPITTLEDFEYFLKLLNDEFHYFKFDVYKIEKKFP